MLSSFWSFWVQAIVIGSMIACGILIVYTSKGQKKEETDETTGHSYDGIEELDNPLPRWWVGMFWATIVFGFGYIGIYGLANFDGIGTVKVDGEDVTWTQTNQWKAEVQAFDEKIAPLYEGYLATPIAELAQNEEAMQTGGRLFKSYCAVCHGSNAMGAQGFPNLTDHDWLYGGEPAQIKQTIMYGRQAAMPAWEAAWVNKVLKTWRSMFVACLALSMTLRQQKVLHLSSSSCVSLVTVQTVKVTSSLVLLT